MIIIALFSWWYTTGWAQLVKSAVARIVDTLNFFSVGALAKSLFAPFRQISVGRVRGSLSVQIRAWADLQISRGIGAMVRLSVIAFGLIASILMTLAMLLIVLAWPFVPLLPFVLLIVATRMA